MADSNGNRRLWVELLTACALGIAVGALSAYPRLSVIEDHLHSIDLRLDKDELLEQARVDGLDGRLRTVENAAATNGNMLSADERRLTGIQDEMNMFLAPYRSKH